MNRNVWATIIATVVVVAVIVLGFHFLGSPESQRKIQSDLRRVTMLAQLAQQINLKCNGPGNELPKTLDDFPGSLKQDPITGKEFDYRRKAANKYELCASFDTDNRQDSEANPRWSHPTGNFCFQFDPSQPVPPAPYYY